MATTGLSAALRERPGLAILDLAGDINADAEPALDAAYAQAAAGGSPAVLLNFGGVGYINSTGIALIVGLLARARREHRAILACGLSPHYQEIFQITRLTDFIRVYPDEGSAAAGLPAA